MCVLLYWYYTSILIGINFLLNIDNGMTETPFFDFIPIQLYYTCIFSHNGRTDRRTDTDGIHKHHTPMHAWGSLLRLAPIIL